MDGNQESNKVKQPILKVASGEVHLHNVTGERVCYVCGKPVDDNSNDMVLLRRAEKGKEKEMIFACVEHAGVVQEFIKQYKRPPLGWRRSYAGQSDTSAEERDNSTV